MEEKARVHIFVSGRVQGVFYRKGAQKEAQELGVTGWAHNLADGRVELVAEGKAEKVRQFTEWCKQGTPLAKVDHCDAQFEEYTGDFADFSIREFGF
ncbi:MAG TPA: acylphosphatase [Candidatus Paceibacterota bacterium]